MSSTAATISHPVQPSPYQSKQRQTAKDVIAENVKALIAQLGIGGHDTYSPSHSVIFHTWQETWGQTGCSQQS